MGNTPTEYSRPFSQFVATPPLPEPRKCPKDLLCRVRNPRFVPFPAGSGGGRATSLALSGSLRPALSK